jgi:hypothetical protein
VTSAGFSLYVNQEKSPLIPLFPKGEIWVGPFPKGEMMISFFAEGYSFSLSQRENERDFYSDTEDRTTPSLELK